MGRQERVNVENYNKIYTKIIVKMLEKVVCSDFNYIVSGFVSNLNLLKAVMSVNQL